MPRTVRVECDHCRRGLDRIRGGGLRLLVRAEQVVGAMVDVSELKDPPFDDLYFCSFACVRRWMDMEPVAGEHHRFAPNDVPARGPE